MKERRKRLLSMILACVMLLSLLPITALADDEPGEAGGSSSTSKTVTIDPPQGLVDLPDSLQQVEYIESTSGGQQWIDLGFSPKDHDGLLKSEIDVQYTELPTSGQALSGVGQGSYYWVYGVNTSKCFVTQSGADKKETVWGSADKERHIFMIDQKNAVTALDDDTQNMTVTPLSSINKNVALFKGAYSTPFYTVVKLYSAKFWTVAENGGYELLRYMVPCYATGDVTINGVTITADTVGLYDRVEGKFYANANTAEGAAAFEKGDDVTGFTEITAPLTVTLSPTTMTCTGAALEPTVTVKSGEMELTGKVLAKGADANFEGYDYTVTYTNNTDIGTGTVEVQMSPAYGSKYVRMSFSITAPTDIYYQETDKETSRLYIRSMDGKLYMFLPATADYADLKLHLPEGAVLKSGSNNFTVTSSNNGKLDMTALFGSSMEPGTEYSLTVTVAEQTYNMVLIQSANIPALYITMGGLENSRTNATVTEGDPYTWLDDYINQSKDWKATEGSVLMVNADGTTVTETLKSLKGRGSGSWTYGGNKKSYNIKLEKKAELVPGAGKAKSWCLISNYMTDNKHDSTGLANSTAYWLYDEIGGEAAMQYQQVDLYVNGEYRGTYSLTEKVEINENRVDITETEYETEEGTSTKVADGDRDPAIAAGIKEYYYSNGTTLKKTTSGGGFLLEVNDYYDEVCKFKTRLGVKFTLKEPEYATKEQVQQIAIYVQEFEDALFSDTGYNSQGKHYSEYVDLESLAKKLIVDAFMGNGDSMKNSGYFHIDATTTEQGGVNFNGKMMAGPAWDYDYWSSFTDTENLWTNNNCHGKVWLDKLLEKGDFMDILYQLNETSFKSALAEWATMLPALVEKLTPSKTMEDVFMGNDFAGKSADTITDYNNRLTAWNSTVWNSGRLMGVTVECATGRLTANVNGTATSYQWYKLDENHNATAIAGATEATYTPTAVGEYQVAVTGTSMEPALSTTITMYSAPITVKDSNGSYTLTLDCRGGTLPEGAAETFTVTPDGDYPALPTPTKAGCYFLGWFTRPQGGTKITSVSTAPTYGADCTLYARWKITETVQDVDDVTGVAMTSDSGSVIWEREDVSALTGLILCGNETGTAPSAELSVPRLPAAYQEVEYIESTSDGLQWIDLGFSPNQYSDKLKSEIDLQYTVLPTGSAQGLGGASINSTYYLIYGATASAFKMQSGGNNEYVTWPYLDTNRHTFVLDQKNNTATLDGSSKALSGSAGSVTTNVALFKLNSSSNPYYSVMRLYSAKFSYWDETENQYKPLRDLVPCYEIATGQVGLYDLVNDVFYANANTNGPDFSFGPDVYTPNEATSETVTSPVALYAVGDVRDSYNAVTGVVTRRVQVDGSNVTALPEAEWTTEQTEATHNLTQYTGVNCAAYAGGYAAPITVVHTPASVTLSESEFTYNGSEQKPTVTVTVNGTLLTEGTDYTVAWPANVTNVGEKEVVVTINNENYNGTLYRTYTIKAATMTGVPATGYNGPYDGQPHGITVTAPEDAAVMYGTTEGTYNLNDSPIYTNFTDGPQTVYYKVTKEGYTDVTGSATVNITKKVITGASVGTFAAMTYTGSAQTPSATVTVGGLTVTGIWSQVTNVSDTTTFTADGNFTGTITGQNPGMAKKVVDALDLTTLVAAPVKNGTPQSSITHEQYTGTISWSDSPAKFLGGKVYTATLTLTATDNYTLTGVAANSFAYTGATVANGANSGTVTITFPETSAASVSSIAIKTGATKLTYTVGDELDVSGLVITAVMDDETTSDIPVTAAMVSGFDSSAAAASQTLTITYGGKTTNYSISIEAVQNTYTITFDPNGGAVTPTSGVTGADGKLSSLPTPTRSGSYTFDGWYTAASGGTQVTTATVFDADTTIYARWTAIPTGGGSSGGSGSAAYTVSAPTDVMGGAMGVSPKNASKGTTVTITVKPDEGYKLDSLTVTDAAGNTVAVSGQGNTYIFVMPNSAVSVSASFVKVGELPFVDVGENHTFRSYIEYVYENGIMQGNGDRFDSTKPLTRAQLVVTLYRMAGSPGADGTALSFSDTDKLNTEFANAVKWAVANGIVGGYEDGSFRPSDPVTRQAMMSILYRYANSSKFDTDVSSEDNLSRFQDGGTVSDKMTEAVNWAVDSGFVSGNNGQLNPAGSTTRGAAAKILAIFHQTYLG